MVASPPHIPRDRFAGLRSSTILQQVLLTLGLIALLFLVFVYSRSTGEDKATEWLDKYNGVGTNKAARPITTSKPTPDTTNSNTASGGSASANTNTNANVSSTASDNANTATGNQNQNSAGATSGGAGSSRDTAQSSEQQTGAIKLDPAKVNQRLDQQLVEIRARIEHHGAVMAYFFKAYYTAISMIMFAGLIAALSLFFIAQVGWSDAKPPVKTIFLVMTAASVYFGLSPTVFQQQQNISDNKSLFLAYKALENEVVSYRVTGLNIKAAETKLPGFVSYVDTELARLGNIAIGFDYTKITFKDAFDVTGGGGQSTPTRTPNTNQTP